VLARQARAPCQMLYPRWLETLRRHADCPAIFDGGQVLTFSELSGAVSQRPVATAPVIARSGGPGFFVEILRAWRDGQAVIPVERDAPDPQLARPPVPGTCLVKYTPGASGIPRGIFLNPAQVAADGDRIVSAMGLSPEVPNLGVVSLAHSYGFSNIVLPLLLHGVPVHLAPLPFPRVIEEIFRAHAALIVPAVPSMWRAWQRGGILPGAPIQLALSAGAPLSLALELEVFAAASLKIHNFYGASECGGISWDATTTPRASADDVGTPLPGVEISTNSDGQFTVKSASVATGYDAPRGDELISNGVYQTRDFGHLDAHGRLHLTGTLGGAINVAGRKVSPAKVEAALLATGLVTRVKVGAVPSKDPERFEEISATVELVPGATVDALKQAVSQRLQGWEIPRKWCDTPTW
jgi:long-chain acyl-CoA synthetase